MSTLLPAMTNLRFIFLEYSMIKDKKTVSGGKRPMQEPFSVYRLGENRQEDGRTKRIRTIKGKNRVFAFMVVTFDLFN